MARKAPSWWYAEPGIRSLLLAPAALAWDLGTRLRWALARPYRSRIPVICVGNFTAGGAGKTPAAMAIARMIQQSGKKPVFLTRGYGGRTTGPHLVDRHRDTAEDVGDEPLLLASIAPTIVAANKVAGARLAENLNAQVIIMDDGFQNPTLYKDLAFLVVDRLAGVGNGRVIPAGPLRASVASQIGRASALIPVGRGDCADGIIEKSREAGLPVLESEILTRDRLSWLQEKPLVAFAGIGKPDKFFNLLQDLGARIVQTVAFPDHHYISEAEAAELLQLGANAGAQLVTTEKDMVRILGPGPTERLRRATRAVPVRLRFKDQGKVKRLLARTVNAR